MRRLFLYTICGLIATSGLKAQTTLLSERQKSDLSPSETRFEHHATDMDVRKLKQLYSNPAFYDLIQQEKEIVKVPKYRSSVYTGYANGEAKGDFLHYQGNGFEDFRLGASGEYSIRKIGTLYGSIQYSRGKHKNIGWSAMRYPELYLPYISTDSIGGDYNFEDYRVEGGFSFNINDWTLGIRGIFHGEQAHRITDPRALNNTTWLNVGVGVARTFNGHLLMVEGDFGRNKQNMDVRYWRPGEQDRFFICYGFGLYDVRESGVSFGYSRMFYIKEGNAHLTYQSPAGKPFTIYANLGYEYDRMKAEESDIQTLYYSKTNNLKPSAKIDWEASSSLLLSLWAESDWMHRKGFENIYERYLSDVANNIYDYRKVDTQQNYIFKQSNSLAQLRLRYKMTPKHTFGVQGGVSFFTRKEEQTKDKYSVKNITYFPHGKVDYRMEHKRSELELGVLYGKQLNAKHDYDVILKNQSIEHLDFQQTFAPYAYFNSTYSSLQMSASYIYHFKKCGLGVTLKLMYVTGDRDKDAIYSQHIGFASTAPMISATPDKHDELWGSSSLFFIF